MARWATIRRATKEQVRWLFLSSDTRPRIQTVTISLICFVLFIVIIAVSASRPSNLTRYLVGILGLLLLLVSSILAGKDLWWKTSERLEKPEYNSNLGNTLWTVTVTIPLMASLYIWLWWGQLNSTELQLSTRNTKTDVQFPSIAIFQTKWWAAQGKLNNTVDSKCFLGRYNNNATACSTLNSTQLSNTTSCKCGKFWSSIQDQTWQNTSYRYEEFISPSWLISSIPSRLMLLQIFFDYDIEEAIIENTYLPNPQLSLAIYDPEFSTVIEALEQNYTRLIDINGLGLTSVNLGLTFRQPLGQKGRYDYSPSISSVPARDISCDKQNYTFPCVATIYIRFPTFEETVITERKSLEWLDVAAAAGAYYSFVQFVSWMLSGQATAA